MVYVVNMWQFAFPIFPAFSPETVLASIYTLQAEYRAALDHRRKCLHLFLTVMGQDPPVCEPLELRSFLYPSLNSLINDHILKHLYSGFLCDTHA